MVGLPVTGSQNAKLVDSENEYRSLFSDEGPNSDIKSALGELDQNFATWVAKRVGKGSLVVKRFVEVEEVLPSNTASTVGLLYVG